MSVFKKMFDLELNEKNLSGLTITEIVSRYEKNNKTRNKRMRQRSLN